MATPITPDNRTVTAHASGFGKFFIYVTFILIIPIFWFIGKRNSLIRTRVKINETASDIDVQLKRRRDLLIKLVDSTKGYMKYEKATLTKIVEERSGNKGSAGGKIDPKDFSKINHDLNSLARQINVTVENYPDLKSNQAVINLQAGIKDAEDNIAASRRFYNAAVQVFNSGIQTYPGNVIGANLKATTYPFFEADESDRADVSVDLSLS